MEHSRVRKNRLQEEVELPGQNIMSEFFHSLKFFSRSSMSNLESSSFVETRSH